MYRDETGKNLYEKILYGLKNFYWYREKYNGNKNRISSKNKWDKQDSNRKEMRNLMFQTILKNKFKYRRHKSKLATKAE